MASDADDSDVCHYSVVPPHLPYPAYLRVYQPLSAYSSAERAHWRAYADSPNRPRRVATLSAEHGESLRRLVSAPARAAPAGESEYAYLRRRGSDMLVCPWQTRLRSWISFGEFCERTPAPLIECYLPRAAAERVASEFAAWRSRGGGVRTQIQTTTWHIPLAWFLPFSPEERCLILGSSAPKAGNAEWTGGPDSGDPVLAPARTLLYLTEMAQARRRTEEAVAVLRRTLGDGALLTAVEQVQEWLHDWHPRSLVELDYGGLVGLLEDEEMLADRSPQEASSVIAGLAAGENESAFEMYRRFTRRWRRVQRLASAN